MCLAKIWPLVFLDSPHHLLDRFWGPQDGDFGFSSGGYQGRGAQASGEKHDEITIFGVFFLLWTIVQRRGPKLWL